jgi:hypothetical protein
MNKNNASTKQNEKKEQDGEDNIPDEKINELETEATSSRNQHHPKLSTKHPHQRLQPPTDSQDAAKTVHKKAAAHSHQRQTYEEEEEQPSPPWPVIEHRWQSITTIEEASDLSHTL